VEVVKRELHDKYEALHQLKHHLQRAQGRMKVQAHRQHTVGARSTRSWLLCGPLQILEKLGMVAYRLLFPETCRVHSVFDVRLLEVKNY